MKSLNLLRFGLGIALGLLVSSSLRAATPGIINYQGRMAVEGAPFNGTGYFKFALVDEAGSTTYWSHDGTSAGGSEPSTAIPLDVEDGLYSVALGDTAIGVQAIPASVFGDHSDVRLRVWFDGGGHGSQLLEPDQRIAAVGYALHAESVTESAISSGQIADESILGADIQDGTIAAADVADGAVLAKLLNEDGADSGLDADKLDGLSSTAFWQAGGNAGTTPGVNFIGTTDDQAIEFHVDGQRALRIEPKYDGAGSFLPNFIGGTTANSVGEDVYGATIAGGGAEGFPNQVLEDYGTVGGGYSNEASGARSTVGGGDSNVASGSDSTVGGGDSNVASGSDSTVGGGYSNEASGARSTVPGGAFNTAQGAYSLAAGQRAKANHHGAFVWGDSQFSDFASTGANQFLIRASGGVGIGTASPGAQLHVHSAGTGSGSHTANFSNTGIGPNHSHIHYGTKGDWYIRSAANDGKVILQDQSGGLVGIGTSNPTQKLHVIGNILASGTVTGGSDRNIKENFEAVNTRQVLEKVVAMPVQRWNYIGEETPHLGPVAQDFHAAFQVGMDDKHISMVDADGVSLAAIQGLNLKVTELSKENATLKKEVEELKQLVHSLIDPSQGGVQ